MYERTSCDRRTFPWQQWWRQEWHQIHLVSRLKGSRWKAGVRKVTTHPFSTPNLVLGFPWNMFVIKLPWYSVWRNPSLVKLMLKESLLMQGANLLQVPCKDLHFWWFLRCGWGVGVCSKIGPCSNAASRHRAGFNSRILSGALCNPGRKKHGKRRFITKWDSP